MSETAPTVNDACRAKDAVVQGRPGERNVDSSPQLGLRQFGQPAQSRQIELANGMSPTHPRRLQLRP